MTEVDIQANGTVFDGPVLPRDRQQTGASRTSYAQRLIDSPTLYTAADNSGAANRNPEGIGLFALIAEDYRSQGGGPFSQGFWALFWHRFGNWRMSVKPRALRVPLTLIYKFGVKLTQWFAGIDLPYTVNVGRRVRLEHFGGMILVARAIGDDVIIRQNTTLGIAHTDRLHDWPVIGDGADVGVGCAILGRVDVGRGAKIGANAVVLKDIPEGAVAVGVPARVIAKV